jgi:hypothetical protein
MYIPSFHNIYNAAYSEVSLWTVDIMQNKDIKNVTTGSYTCFCSSYTYYLSLKREEIAGKLISK